MKLLFFVFFLLINSCSFIQNKNRYYASFSDEFPAYRFDLDKHVDIIDITRVFKGLLITEKPLFNGAMYLFERDPDKITDEQWIFKQAALKFLRDYRSIALYDFWLKRQENNLSRLEALVKDIRNKFLVLRKDIFHNDEDFKKLYKKLSYLSNPYQFKKYEYQNYTFKDAHIQAINVLSSDYPMIKSGTELWHKKYLELLILNEGEKNPFKKVKSNIDEEIRRKLQPIFKQVLIELIKKTFQDSLVDGDFYLYNEVSLKNWEYYRYKKSSLRKSSLNTMELFELSDFLEEKRAPKEVYPYKSHLLKVNKATFIKNVEIEVKENPSSLNVSYRKDNDYYKLFIKGRFNKAIDYPYDLSFYLFDFLKSKKKALKQFLLLDIINRLVNLSSHIDDEEWRENLLELYGLLQTLKKNINSNETTYRFNHHWVLNHYRIYNISNTLGDAKKSPVEENTKKFEEYTERNKNNIDKLNDLLNMSADNIAEELEVFNQKYGIELLYKDGSIYLPDSKGGKDSITSIFNIRPLYLDNHSDSIYAIRTWGENQDLNYWKKRDQYAEKNNLPHIKDLLDDYIEVVTPSEITKLKDYRKGKEQEQNVIRSYKKYLNKESEGTDITEEHSDVSFYNLTRESTPFFTRSFLPTIEDYPFNPYLLRSLFSNPLKVFDESNHDYRIVKNNIWTFIPLNFEFPYLDDMIFVEYIRSTTKIIGRPLFFIESHKPTEVIEKFATFPTAINFISNIHEIRDQNGDLLNLDEDYIVFERKEYKGYDYKLVKFLNKEVDKVWFKISFHHQTDKNKIFKFKETILEDRKKIFSLIKELNKAGFTRLADALLKLYKSNKKITVSKVSSVFRKSFLYEFSKSKRVMGASTNLNLDDSFSNFSYLIGSNGKICLQCDGANKLLTLFLNKYFKNKPMYRAEVSLDIPRTPFSKKLGPIYHARTHLYKNDLLVGIYDSTPINVHIPGFVNWVYNFLKSNFQNICNYKERKYILTNHLEPPSRIEKESAMPENLKSDYCKKITKNEKELNDKIKNYQEDKELQEKINFKNLVEEIIKKNKGALTLGIEKESQLEKLRIKYINIIVSFKKRLEELYGKLKKNKEFELYFTKNRQHSDNIRKTIKLTSIMINFLNAKGISFKELNKLIKTRFPENYTKMSSLNDFLEFTHTMSKEIQEGIDSIIEYINNRNNKKIKSLKKYNIYTNHEIMFIIQDLLSEIEKFPSETLEEALYFFEN